MTSSKRHLLLFMGLFAVFCCIGQEKMEIEGAIIIKNSEDNSPVPGTIRFNSVTNDFEGWNGTWMSLTNSSPAAGTGTVSDVSGNTYQIVIIGTQTWMRENLRASHYNDGTAITEKPLNQEWNNANPAWSWFDNDQKNDMIYGKLYNWFAIDPGSNGNKNVCPAGWHVPSDAEWHTLVAYLDPNAMANSVFESQIAGGKLKATGAFQENTGLWEIPNTNASNESGFTGLPAGNRSSNGVYNQVFTNGNFWSATELIEFGSPNTSSFYRSLVYNEEYIVRSTRSKLSGLSVRCIKD